MKFALSISFILLMYSNIYAQKQLEGDTIYWQEKRRLVFADFQEKTYLLSADDEVPAKNSAYSSVQIHLTPFIDKNLKSNYTVRNFFCKKISWFGDSTDISATVLLAHEQLHFNINELISRKLRYLILQAYKSGKDVFSSEIVNEIHGLIKACDNMHEVYDKETMHGTLGSKQREWNERIKNGLFKLNLYKSS